MLNPLITYLQNNTPYCALTELSQQALEVCRNHKTLCGFILTIILIGIIHDILVSLFTARIYYVTPSGEKTHIADAMVRGGFGGYRLRIPENALKEVEVPMYHIELKRLLAGSLGNHSIVVECEGFKKDLPLERSIDFVL